MSRRFFSLFLSFVLLIALLPGMAQPVYAAEFTVSDEVVEMLKSIGFTYIIVPCRGEHIKVEI